MIDEINVHEERSFLICEAAFQTKETAVKRPVACAIDSCDQIGVVVRSKSTDFYPASIAQRLYRGIFLNFRHEKAPTIPINLCRRSGFHPVPTLAGLHRQWSFVKALTQLALRPCSHYRVAVAPSGWQRATP